MHLGLSPGKGKSERAISSLIGLTSGFDFRFREVTNVLKRLKDMTAEERSYVESWLDEQEDTDNDDSAA
jgi:hypothetical protein